VDPLTLFALANGAVSAVKAGCKLYKDIKSAAGDVKAVLKDLDNQFHDAYAAKGKTPSPEAKKQFQEEKTRIVELNKKSADTTNIYTEIGEHLGTYYDNFYKCMAVFEEEEKRSKTEIYTGEASLGKRALQRVLMRKQLEQMGTELQELMIYQSPPELGALWTEVNEMMKKMGKEQKVLITKQMEIQAIQDKRRRARMRKLREEFATGVAILVIILVMGGLFMWVAYDRQQKYPQYGDGLFPKSEERRKEEAIPKKYVGR
jgi:hypothetical protein